MPAEASDFAIAELIVWNRGLASEEMHAASDHLLSTVLGVGAVEANEAKDGQLEAPKRAEHRRLFSLSSSLKAWYKENGFSIGGQTWTDATGNGHTATLSASGLSSATTSSAHGSGGSVTALQGTTAGTVTFGTDIISSSFTICSITRYTGTTSYRILNGDQGVFVHGHFEEDGVKKTGTACYNTWRTSGAYVTPDTNWVAMCGTNAESNEILVNGNNVGVNSGGTGSVNLGINVGTGMPTQASTFEVVEVLIWDKGLTSAEMQTSMDYL
eukprot:561738-Prymnesium_polylepis.1